MSFVVGLDIGTRKLKGVVLSGTPRAYRVVDVFIETIPSLGGDSLNGGADGGAEEGGGEQLWPWREQSGGGLARGVGVRA